MLADVCLIADVMRRRVASAYDAVSENEAAGVLGDDFANEVLEYLSDSRGRLDGDEPEEEILGALCTQLRIFRTTEHRATELLMAVYRLLGIMAGMEIGRARW